MKTHGLPLFKSGRPLQQETGALEKVLVSSFMMVLVFFSRAIGDPRPVTEAINSVDGEKAARALDSLSCVEFCRHVQMKDYGSLVEHCVSFVAADSSATKAFASFLPPYNNVVQTPGTWITLARNNDIITVMEFYFKFIRLSSRSWFLVIFDWLLCILYHTLFPILVHAREVVL